MQIYFMYLAPMQSNMQIILTSVDRKESAEKMARSLVETHLAACVHIMSAGMSFYFWQDKMESSEEYQILIKTCSDNTDNTLQWLKTHHPYDVPEIICLDGFAAKDYLAWMQNTKPLEHDP